MPIDQIPTSLVISVIVVALVVGVICIATINIVWFKKQVFGAGGSVLSFCGLVLIGLSVWGNVQFEGAGIKLSLQNISQQIANEDPESAGVLLNEVIQKNPELGQQLVQEVASKNPTLVADRLLLMAETNQQVYRSLSSKLTTKNVADLKLRLNNEPEREELQLQRSEAIRMVPTN